MAAKLSRHGLTGRTITPPSPSPPTSAPCSFMASITLRLADRGAVHGAAETGRHVVHHAARRDAGHDGAGLALEPALDDEDDGASVPSGVPCSSTMASRSASASWAKPTSAPERVTRSPEFRQVRSSAPAFGSGDPGGSTATTSQPSASSNRERGSRRRAAPGIDRDPEPRAPNALARRPSAVTARRCRAIDVVSVRTSDMSSGPHARVDALVVEVGQLGRLVGAEGEPLGVDEPERVPLERAVASAHGDAAERAGLAHVEHQGRDGDDARRRPACTPR